MVWLIAFAVLAGAWFTASLALLLVNRAMVQSAGRRAAMVVRERLRDAPILPVPESTLRDLRTMAECDCDDCRDFWIDHGQEIQTLAEEASAKAIEAAKKSEAVN